MNFNFMFIWFVLKSYKFIHNSIITDILIVPFHCRNLKKGTLLMRLNE